METGPKRSSSSCPRRCGVATLLLCLLTTGWLLWPRPLSTEFSHQLGNASCFEKPLLGTYHGDGQTEVMGLTFKWSTTNVFHEDGTHDVDQVATEDPMNTIPNLHCRNVPIAVNLSTCTFLIERDECMNKALNGLQILRERGSWDPDAGSLFYELVVTVPRVSAIVMDLSYSLQKVSGSDVSVTDGMIDSKAAPEPDDPPTKMVKTLAAMASDSAENAKMGMHALSHMADGSLQQISNGAEQLYDRAAHPRDAELLVDELAQPPVVEISSGP